MLYKRRRRQGAVADILYLITAFYVAAYDMFRMCCMLYMFHMCLYKLTSLYSVLFCDRFYLYIYIYIYIFFFCCFNDTTNNNQQQPTTNNLYILKHPCLAMNKHFTRDMDMIYTYSEIL